MGNKRIFIASLLLFLLACCRIDEGIIVDKRHEDSCIIYQPMFIGKVMHMQPIFIDESWDIKVRSNDKECWVDVDKQEWDKASIGDTWHRSS